MQRHGITVTPHFYFGLFDGGAWFYSDEWPYHGSILQIGGQPPILQKSGLDLPGVYYRYVRFPAHTTWSLMVSLWYPVLLLAILPAVWIFHRRRFLRMNHRLALLWLALTMAPLGYVVCAVTYLASGQSASAEGARAESDMIRRLDNATMIGTSCLVASYMIYLFKTRHVRSDKRALWAVALVLGSFIAMPIFWFLHVWRPLRSASAARPA
jgi:hypothetical protein